MKLADGVQVVEDVAPLGRRIEGGVDDREIAHLARQAQLREPLLIRFGQMRARPIDRLLGHLVEIARRLAERGLFVVISLHAGAIQLAHDLDALMRIGVVADEIAQANEMRAFLFARIVQDRFGRLEIGVEITEDGEAHGRRKNLARRIRDALIERNVELVFEKFQTAD